MPPYEHHVFVCTHHRPETSSHPACTMTGESEFLNRLKELVAEAGIRSRVRINRAGCLGRCKSRAVAVVYPEGIWYGGVTAADAEELFREHLLGNRPVERLKIPADKLAVCSHEQMKDLESAEK